MSAVVLINYKTLLDALRVQTTRILSSSSLL